MKNYFAYIRVSTNKQGEHGVSLIEQRSAIEAYAARHNLRIVGWYRETVTAAKQGRRAFSAMLTELGRGKAGGLIVHKIDRSARNLRDWSALGDLIDRGIDVRFVSDNFDLLSRGGRLSADIQAVVAADYIRNLREEVKKGQYGRLKLGYYPFTAPVGYINNGKGKLKTIDPSMGPVVRHAFERYATGAVGINALRGELATMGLRTKAGQPLFPNAISVILTNPFYTGIIKIRRTGEVFAGAHEPLISPELFERVQKALRARTAPKAKKHICLLRQIVRCGSCGRRRLTGELQKGHVYYRCHADGCKGVSWREDFLEGAFLAEIAVICLTEVQVREVRDLVEVESRNHRDEQAKLHTALMLQLRHLDGRMERLTDLLIDGTIDGPTYNVRKEKLLLERAAIEERIKRADTVSPLADLFEKFERCNGELLRYKLLAESEKRELVQMTCSNFSANEKEPVIMLKSPYLELQELGRFQECAPHRGDVRTKSQKIFEVLKSIAEASVSRPGTICSPDNPPQHPQCP